MTTNDKIAEVGRIERINQEAKANAVDAESAMQTIVAQAAWNEDRRTVSSTISRYKKRNSWRSELTENE